MQIDNFQQLYELALKLIDADLAYVCHMTADELKGIDSPDSPWRNRPKEETHALFRDMKNGKIAEGQVKDFRVTGAAFRDIPKIKKSGDRKNSKFELLDTSFRILEYLEKQ